MNTCLRCCSLDTSLVMVDAEQQLGPRQCVYFVSSEPYPSLCAIFG
jgi:hypothetical protein